jgi:hypothetical protein
LVATLNVLVVEAYNKPLGMLPLVAFESGSGLGSRRVLSTAPPECDWVVGPVGSQPAVVWLAALRHLTEHGGWDSLDLRWIAPAAGDGGRALNALRQVSMTPSIAHRSAAEIEWIGNWNEYWQSRPLRWRESIDALWNDVRARSAISFEHYRPRGQYSGDDDLGREMWQLCGHASANWRRPLRPVLNCLHTAASAAGVVEWSVLVRDGIPTAAVYGYRRGDAIEVQWLAGESPDAMAVLLRDWLARTHQLGTRTVTLPLDSWSDFELWSTRERVYEGYDFQRGRRWLAGRHVPQINSLWHD